MSDTFRDGPSHVSFDWGKTWIPYEGTGQSVLGLDRATGYKFQVDTVDEKNKTMYLEPI